VERFSVLGWARDIVWVAQLTSSLYGGNEIGSIVEPWSITTLPCYNRP